MWALDGIVGETYMERLHGIVGASGGFWGPWRIVEGTQNCGSDGDYGGHEDCRGTVTSEREGFVELRENSRGCLELGQRMKNYGKSSDGGVSRKWGKREL